MRLKLISIYGVLVILVGVSTWFFMDWKLSASQETSLSSAAEEATAHARAAFDARGLNLVALANLAAGNPRVAGILDQWRKVSSEDTRLRIVRRFLQLTLDVDRRRAFDRIVEEEKAKGAAARFSLGGLAPAAPAAPAAAEAAPAVPAGGATGALERRTPVTVARAASPFSAASAGLPPKGSDAASGGSDSAKAARSGSDSAKAAPAPGEPAAEPPAAAPAEPAAAAAPAAPAAPVQPAGTGAAPSGGAAAPAAGAAPAPSDATAAEGGEAAPAGEPDLAGLAVAYRNGGRICARVGCTDEERVPFFRIFASGIAMCEGPTCSDQEVGGLFTLLNAATILTAKEFDFEACAKAYAGDLEKTQRDAIDKQVAAIEAQRAAEAAAAAAAAGGRRREGEAVAAPPVEVSFSATTEFDVSKYPACEAFARTSVAGLSDEINGRLFAVLGNEAALIAQEDLTEKTRFKVEFVWLIDAQSGRGIAKDREFRKDTPDHLYYKVGINDIFEGITPEAATKIVEQVRAGMVYRDVWVTKKGHEDLTTGFVDVAMVPSMNAEGRTGGLVAVAVKVENLAPIARDVRSKVVLIRKVPGAPPGQDTGLVGSGNDDPNQESLEQDFLGAVLANAAADVRTVAGNDPSKEDGSLGARDFESGGAAFLMKATGIVNTAGALVRGDQQFAIGPLAMVVLVDKGPLTEIGDTLTWTWVFTGVAALLAIIMALVLAHHFLKPITQIEDGLLRIMNGDWTHRFDVRSAEVGGLSYRINQLMAALLGDDEEAEPGSEAGDQGVADPKEARYQELYTKFQGAQRQVGQEPGSVSYADFRSRLLDNEQKIAQKNPGKQIDFEILVSANQITFKPIVK